MFDGGGEVEVDVVMVEEEGVCVLNDVVVFRLEGGGGGF